MCLYTAHIFFSKGDCAQFALISALRIFLQMLGLSR